MLRFITLQKKNSPVSSKTIPHIDKLWLYDNNLNEIIPQIRETHIDYIIDLHHNLRTQRIKNSLRILSFTFNKLNYAKWLMVNFKINRLPDIHIVDRYLETVSVFNVKNDRKGLDYFPGEDKSAFSVLKQAVCPHVLYPW